MRDTVFEPRMVRVETRLLAIPLIFILLRIWGTIQFFFSLAVADNVRNGCVPHSNHVAFFVLGILQVRPCVVASHVYYNTLHTHALYQTH